MTLSGVKMSIAVIAFMVFSLCSARSVGLSNLAGLAQISTQSDEAVACQYCNEFVQGMDKYGVKPQFNTSKKLAKGFEEICPQMGQGTPDEAFCKVLEGKFDVFAKAYYQHKDDPEVDPCKLAGVCSAKSVGFKNLAKLSKVFALSNESVACKECYHLVKLLDRGELGEEYNTSKKLAIELQNFCKQHPEDPFCNALKGQYEFFARVYFLHKDNPENNPCVAVEVCPAKTVGFKNLSKLSNVFALSDQTPACENCNQLLAVLDSGELAEEYNTPEKLAKFLQDGCAKPPASEGALCKALKGKFDVLANAYFQRRKDDKVNPCKVAQVC